MNRVFKIILPITAIIFYILFLKQNIYLPLYATLKLNNNYTMPIQIFYDTGNGYNELESSRVTKNNDQNYHFELPNKKIIGLRLDPDNSSSNIKIQSLEITNLITSKKYSTSDINGHLATVHNMSANNKLSWTVVGTDPQLILNDFLSRDFVALPLKIKLAIVGLSVLLGYIFILFTRTTFTGHIKDSLHWLVGAIENSIDMKNLNLNYRLDFYMYLSFLLLIIYSSMNTSVFSLSSLLYGFGFTIIALSFSAIGLILLHLTPKAHLSNIIKRPFHALFVGQLVIFVYIYLRSALNQYIHYIPISIFECFIIFAALFGALLFTNKKKDFVTYLAINKKSLYLSFWIFFLVMVLLSDNELPRFFMLSTDPDVHAFFGKQIERFGTIPYHQFYWGSEGFNYPAGTGVLGYIWSMFSYIDIRNALHIQPILQLTIGIFIIVEMLQYKSYELKKIFLITTSLIIVFLYFMRYSYEPNHFHLEGTGRLMSISLVTFIVSFFVYSIINRHNNNTILSFFSYVIVVVFLIFYSMALNPVNIFYTIILLSVSLLLFFSKNKKLYFFIPIIFIFLLIIFLEPYYLNTFIYKTNNNSVQITNYKPLTLSLNELLSYTFENIKNRIFQVNLFFKMSIFKFPMISFYIIFGASLVVVYYHFTLKQFRQFKQFQIFYLTLLLLLIVFLIWIFIGSFLDVLSRSATDYRLLDPYFAFATSQYMYVIILIMIALAGNRVIKYIYNIKAIIAFIVMSLGISLLLNFYVGNIINSTKRSESGIRGNNINEDDIYVINQIELFSKNFINSDKRPKILIPNAMPIMGIEKWLFPSSSGSILPFYDTLPLAFYYFKGESFYTYENYEKHICENFNLDWLKSNNIQFLFIPSQNDGCIDGIDHIKKNYHILAKKNNSYFIELYN